MAAKAGAQLLSTTQKTTLTKRAEVTTRQLTAAAESGSLKPPARAFLLTEILRLLAASPSGLAQDRRDAIQASIDAGATVTDMATTLTLTPTRVYQLLAGTGRSGIRSRPLVAGPGPGRPTNAERDARTERAGNADRIATAQTTRLPGTSRARQDGTRARAARTALAPQVSKSPTK